MRADQIRADFLVGVELAIEIAPEDSHHGLRCRLAYLIGHMQSTHPEISASLRRLDVKVATSTFEPQA
jgi:hypothetical protein